MALPLPAVAIFAGIGLFLLGAGVRELLRALRMRGTERTPIDELSGASGRVVVSGVARRADRTVTGPFTGRDCLAHSWRVDALRREYTRDGVRYRRSIVDRGRDAVPFLVDDGTGTVLVDPQGADLRLVEEWVTGYVPDRGNPGDLVFDLEAVLGLGEEDPNYYEARLDEGETVAVHGTATEDADGFRAGRVGVRISGRGTLVSDVDESTMERRSLRAAAESIVLGLLCLGGLAVLWVIV